MQAYHKKGLCTAAGITGLFLCILMITAAFTGDINWSLTGLIGIPWSVCPGVAVAWAKARANTEILNPKGMSLQRGSCFAYKILLFPILGSISGHAQLVGVGA